MTQKYRKLLSDTFIFAVGNVGSKIILFFMVPLYTNILSTEEFGDAEFVFTVAQLLLPFVSLVIFDAVIRFGLSKEEVPENVLLSGLVVVCVGSVITILLTPLFKLYETLSQWRWYLSAYVILNMLGSVEMNFLKVLDKNKIYALISVVSTTVLALSNVLFLVVKSLGVKGYLLASVCGSLITVLLAFFLGGLEKELRKARLDLQLIKRMLTFSAPLILNNVSWWVIQSSDKIMIEAMIGSAALGLYTVATKIPSFVNVLTSIFSQAWGVSSVKELESDNDERFYADVFRFFSVVVFGASIALITIIKPFMRIYVGSEYYAAWRYVPLLLVSASFAAIASYYGSLYGALKFSVRNMLSTLISALINIVVNYLYMLKVGVWGAIIGTLSAYLFIALFRMIDVLRFIRFEVEWKKFILNSMLVIFHAVIVSMNYHTEITSCIVVLLFAMINRKVLYGIIQRIVRLKR